MRAIFPFVLLAVAATLPACTCASSEPGAPAATGAAGAPDGAAGTGGAATGASSARLVRGRLPGVRLNTNLNTRNLRPAPTLLPTAAPAASAP
jgi:hypothetical protein